MLKNEAIFTKNYGRIENARNVRFINCADVTKTRKTRVVRGRKSNTLLRLFIQCIPMELDSDL